MANKAPLVKRALAEFLGTFILVSAVTNVVAGGGYAPAKFIAPLCVASALMIGVYCVGNVSGGHLNPAVSFGVYLMNASGHTQFTAKEFGVYAAAQLLAGLIGGFVNVTIWHTTLGGASSSALNSNLVLSGNLTYPMDGHLIGSNQTNVSATEGGLLSIGLAEIIYTAVLVFVVLNVATCGDEGKGMKNSYFGLAIGFVLAAGATAIGSISMCALNPAVAFALALLDTATANLPWMGYDTTWPLLMFLFYTFVELIGAAVAVGLFVVVRHHQINDLKGPSGLSKFVSEVIGTFVLCLTVMLVVHAPASAVGCVGIASSLMVMIYALGAVSGGNFNPAVSLGLLIAQALSLIDFVMYVVAQLLGALLALLTSWLILRRIDVALVAKDVPSDSSKFGAAHGSWGAIIIAEAVFTFALVFTVLNTAVRDSPNQYFGLAIGFVIVVGAAAEATISGACFNPAVSIMLDFAGLIDNEYRQFGAGFFFVLIELLAAALAGLCYRCISPAEDDDYIDKLEDAEVEEGDSSDYE